MKIAIHQANYFPYPGFFHKINQADVFVIQDSVKFVNLMWNNFSLF